MLTLAEESAWSFREQFLDRTISVLWEQRNSSGIWSGFTDNYIKVYARSNGDLTNRLLPVRLFELRGDGVWGKIEKRYDSACL
jgi:threonylcarbamoyladenosine tRNA methylthiotransferase MtaB